MRKNFETYFTGYRPVKEVSQLGTTVNSRQNSPSSSSNESSQNTANA